MATSLLVLWDIDHTLIETGSVGSEVFGAAFEDATGRPLVDVTDTTGKLEPVIFAATCAANGIQVTAELFEEFAHAQIREYRHREVDLLKQGRVLPGVREVLGALAGTPGVVQTILSGNTLRSGRAKMEIYGLAPLLDLPCAVGGEDAGTRPALVPVAWDRVSAVHGRVFGPADTVVIGDTPADVETALRNDCRLVGVATGKASAEELRKAGAQVVLPDLSDCPATLEAILGRPAA